MPVIAATSPADCFDAAAYNAAKIALEHMTPVVLLTDAFVANGSAAWRLPNIDEYPAIPSTLRHPRDEGRLCPLPPQPRDRSTLLGTPRTGRLHPHPRRTGEGQRHRSHLQRPGEPRQDVPPPCREGRPASPCPTSRYYGRADDADLLIVGFGGTYGHLYTAMEEMLKAGHKVALAHFSYINPLPKNTTRCSTATRRWSLPSRPRTAHPNTCAMKVDDFIPLSVQPGQGTALRCIDPTGRGIRGNTQEVSLPRQRGYTQAQAQRPSAETKTPTKRKQSSTEYTSKDFKKDNPAERPGCGNHFFLASSTRQWLKSALPL